MSTIQSQLNPFETPQKRCAIPNVRYGDLNMMDSVGDGQAGKKNKGVFFFLHLKRSQRILGVRIGV